MNLESAFSISPNPRFYYITPNAQAAILKTKYVIQNRQGLTTIIGDVGTGKTSLLRLLYNEYSDNPDYTTAFFVNPKQSTETAFLKAVCTEFEVPTRRSQLDTELELRNFLISEAIAGRTVILFIDEAQQLRGAMFEQIRQILNYESDDTKLLNIVMAGQIELRYKLADPSKRALVSRIAATSNLDTLTLEDVSELINFRCSVSQIENPFAPEAVEGIFQYSKGIPREAIKLCAMSVQYAKLNELEVIPREIVDIAKGDMPELSDFEEKVVKSSGNGKKGTTRLTKAIGK
jgi:general secretion pathway protein A